MFVVDADAVRIANQHAKKKSGSGLLRATLFGVGKNKSIEVSVTPGSEHNNGGGKKKGNSNRSSSTYYRKFLLKFSLIVEDLPKTGIKSTKKHIFKNHAFVIPVKCEWCFDTLWGKEMKCEGIIISICNDKKYPTSFSFRLFNESTHIVYKCHSINLHGCCK